MHNKKEKKKKNDNKKSNEMKRINFTETISKY